MDNLKHVITVNVRQANEAQSVITEISSITVELNDADRMELLNRMGKAVTTRDNAVRVVKRNLSKLGHANSQVVINALNPDIRPMLYA